MFRDAILCVVLSSLAAVEGSQYHAVQDMLVTKVLPRLPQKARRQPASWKQDLVQPAPPVLPAEAQQPQLKMPQPQIRMAQQLQSATPSDATPTAPVASEADEVVQVSPESQVALLGFATPLAEFWKSEANATANATAQDLAQVQTRAGTDQAPADTWQGGWLLRYFPSFWALLQTITFAGAIKTFCIVGNVIVYASPFPTVRRWESRCDTGKADAAPYVSICFGGWQWCWYGTFAMLVTQRSDFLVLIQSNCFGALLGTYYTYAFHKNCRCGAARASLQSYLGTVAFLVALQLCGLTALPRKRALLLSGLVSSLCSFFGALSMLVTVPSVLRTKDSSSLPGALAVANFLSACVWLMCGCMLGDLLVVGPNVVYLVSCLTCFYLKQKYPSPEYVPAKGAPFEPEVQEVPRGWAWPLRRWRGDASSWA